jgi:hypothetical protein
MDHSVLYAEDPYGKAPGIQHLASSHHLSGNPSLAQLLRGVRIGHDESLRVGFDQSSDPVHIQMVGVLMGDQDRRKSA